MKITNHANLPDAIVQAITNDPYDAGESDITCTQLVDSPRIRVLKKQHDDEIEVDASEMIWMLTGKIGHGILQQAETKALTEQRLFAKVNGWKVSGQFDRCVIFPDGLMQDYKFTSIWAVLNGVKPEWEAQLNILRWLASRRGVKINKLELVAILRDWSVGRAKREKDWPKNQVKVLPVKVWPLDVTQEYVGNKVLAHQLAEKALPECTPEQRWTRPTIYAVMKKGRKSAIKLFDSMEAAEDFMEGPKLKTILNTYIETRLGLDVRCHDYCPVAKFCTQFRATQQEKAA